jgi:SAM-dependent methyltransferase
MPLNFSPERDARGNRRAGGEYLNTMTFDEFLERVERQHPFLYMGIDIAKWRDSIDEYAREMNAQSWEFEGNENGGRGAEYTYAQETPNNRSVGMSALLRMFSPAKHEYPSRDTIILDALAGNGTVAEFAASLEGCSCTIVSADISRLMVEDSLKKGLPCIRQSAVRSLITDRFLNGVLLAYGTHHLTQDQRAVAVREASRTLARNGRLVLHDFEIGGPVDKWFREVVHPYSITGHPHPHFDKQQLHALLKSGDFLDIQIGEIDDPIQTSGFSPEEAIESVVRFVHSMYGLTKISIEDPESRTFLRNEIFRTLGPIEVWRHGDTFTASIMRSALVAVGSV